MTQWSSAAMARVAETIRDWTGLTFPDARVRDVEATVRRAMQRRSAASIDDFLGIIAADAVARDQFVAELTIGETYFQRDPAQFDLLQHRILPELLSGRAGDRPVRIWSAGCASGEEPYTMAMVFAELNALDRAHIVGTDIARPRLVDAQRGIYSKWSLRAATEDVRRRYFRERGRYYQLVPEIREQVDFRYLNLAEDHFPSLSIGIWGMDVILCRNVLIYFDAPTVARVARRLIASLSEDGWLILGASDPAIAEMVECDVVLTDAGLVYRRPGAAGADDIRRVHAPGAAGDDLEQTPVTDAEAAPAHVPGELPPVLAYDVFGEPRDTAEVTAAAEPLALVAVDAAAPAADGGTPAATEDELLAAYVDRDFPRVVALGERLEPRGLGADAWIAWVRALANQGCLDEAAAVAERGMKAVGVTAELLYLNAVLLLHREHAAEAAAMVRQALYLDRGMVVAHMTLADAQRRMGRIDEARRALRNAGALLRKMRTSDVVPASDGETAGRLTELVRVKLRLLGEAA